VTAPTTTTICPRCSAAVSGNYCANCGSPLAGATCLRCESALTPGANFCHRCGMPTPASHAAAVAAPSAEARGFSAGLPWGVATVAFVALVALVVGQRFGASARGGVQSVGDGSVLAPAEPDPSVRARAQADTILARSPSHLLGLMLGIRAARATGDTPRAQALERRLLAVEAAERRKQLPEYRLHEREIAAALAAARDAR
jgi:hypothetical protein